MAGFLTRWFLSAAGLHGSQAWLSTLQEQGGQFAQQLWNLIGQAAGNALVAVTHATRQMGGENNGSPVAHRTGWIHRLLRVDVNRGSKAACFGTIKKRLKIYYLRTACQYNAGVLAYRLQQRTGQKAVIFFVDPSEQKKVLRLLQNFVERRCLIALLG